jgi:hypothetical protein
MSLVINDELPSLVTLWLNNNRIADFSYISEVRLNTLKFLRLDNNRV